MAQEWNSVRLLSSCEKLQKVRQEYCDLKHGISFEMWLCALPRFRRQAREYPKLFIISCCWFSSYCLNYPSYASTEKHVFAKYSLSLWWYRTCTHKNFSLVNFLNPQNINFLRIWTKLAIARNFTLPHLSSPFSQFPLF